MSDVLSSSPTAAAPDPVRPDPAHGTTGSRPARQAGPVQAVLLLSASCLSVLGAVLIAPVQPAITRAFAGEAHVALLVPVTLTVPALMIGLIAPFAGRVVDRFGRIRLLTIALVCYAVLGTAPLWLSSLPLIVLSRVGVGITEAAIMTCCTTLLADYYTGERRNRILSMQTVITSVSAVLFISLGGVLGASSWRTPFALYGVALLFAVLVPILLWQPAAFQRPEGALAPVSWRRLFAPCGVSFFGGIAFYTPIVELSFKLDAIGVKSTATIGAVSAVASVATAAGAIVFSSVARRGTAVLLPIAFALAGVGIIVLGSTSAILPVTVGAVLASCGCGLMLPTLLTWALSSLTAEQRGRGTGTWTASLFIGQFLCPIVVLAAGKVLGGLSGGLVFVGALTLVLAVAARMLATRHVRQHGVGEVLPAVA